MTTPFRFIEPCVPVLSRSVPKGSQWQHEVKFDGYRVQVHKAGKDVVIFSRNGRDFTQRFGTMAYLLRELPARSAILDCEIVASNAAGVPDFLALHGRSAPADGLHLWAFDLLRLNSRDARPHSLEERQLLLRTLLRRFDCPAVLPSEAFDDGEALMRAAAKQGLEGIVSKRRGARYVSGTSRNWRKVKTEQWREANQARWRLFGEER